MIRGITVGLTIGAGALIVDGLATRVRLTGFAYAIFSLSFAESLRIVLNNIEAVGSSGGLVGIPAHTTLVIVAAIAAVVLVGFWWFDRTRLGHLRTAIADDEFVVPIFGVPLTATKLTIFALGGVLGGLAGGSKPVWSKYRSKAPIQGIEARWLLPSPSWLYRSTAQSSVR